MEPTKLSSNFSALICEVLKDGIAKLEVVSSLSLDPAEYGLKDKGACHALIEPKTFLRCNEIQGVLNKKKLKDECQETVEFLLSLMEELKLNGTFVTLTSLVESATAHHLKDHFTIANFQRQKFAEQKLITILKNQKDYERQKNDTIDNSLRICKLEHYEKKFNIDLEKNYCKKWVESQLCQNESELELENKVVNRKLFDIAAKSGETDDASIRMCKFYHQRLKELKNETARMNADYEVRIDQVETDYQIALDDKRRLLLMIESERNAFDRREIEMTTYQEGKKKKAAEKKHRELQELKIVVIQAWWRGAMVRHHLGKFKAFKKRFKQIKKEFRLARVERNKHKKRK